MSADPTCPFSEQALTRTDIETRTSGAAITRLRKADAERRAENDYGADFSEALARGITIITAFNAERRQMTLSDVARAVDLPRATARRALYTLARLGYVETEGRLYRLMPKVLKFASAYLTSNPVSTILQPACERLAVQAKTTCSVAVLDGTEVVMVARAVPAQPATIGLGVGYRLPAYCSSLGRVLLSALPERSGRISAEPQGGTHHPADGRRESQTSKDHRQRQVGRVFARRSGGGSRIAITVGADTALRQDTDCRDGTWSLRLTASRTSRCSNHTFQFCNRRPQPFRSSFFSVI